MKINELSKLTKINIETIRLYRKKHFLHPRQLENGYYDYTVEDFASVVHLRKMRELSLSLDEISAQQHAATKQEYYDIFTQRSKDLDAQIKQLQERIKYLEMDKEHLSYIMNMTNDQVLVSQSTDEKIDFYTPEAIQDLHSVFEDSYLTTTISLFIPKEVLNGEIKDEIIPIQTGIGTYRFMFEKHNRIIPSSAAIIPNGTFINQMLTISNLEEINIKDLAPMMQYAKDHNTPFISDTTAYLAYINYEDNIPYYTFRIRACIEENQIPSRYK